jgi:hypothetical protein
MDTLFVKNFVNPVQVELTDFVGNPEVASEAFWKTVKTLLVNSVTPVQVELTDFVGNPEVARELFWKTVETLLVNSVTPVQVELTDFVGNPEAARGNINAWVEKLTKGHIKDLGRERGRTTLYIYICFSRIHLF